MRVGVIDVGSSTARLLVARVSRGALVAVGRERAVLSLGEEIERTGRISDIKLARLAADCEDFARTASALGAVRVSVVVTAPGRQAENRTALVSTLQHATGLSVRVLSPEEEGTLAFEGAVMGAERVRDPVAVCDVGGGSTEVVVGTTDGGPAYVRTVGIGSLRLACRTLSYERPSKRELARARRRGRGGLRSVLGTAAEDGAGHGRDRSGTSPARRAHPGAGRARRGTSTSAPVRGPTRSSRSSVSHRIASGASRLER